MKYVSTRGQAPALRFDEALLTGLARDGGLYVPEEYPCFTKNEISNMQGLSYTELALRIMFPFVEGAISEKDLKTIVEKSYKNFNHTAIAPLKQMGHNLWLMELFHGPTLAFKDYAMQFLGNVFEHVLAKKNEHVTIIGATSGDTGSAAIEACKDRNCMDIFILHPKGKVSEVQRKQMTTVHSSNVFNIALEGSFDDCQNMVKAIFNNQPFRDEFNLSAVNSINWARIMAQIVYYFYAALALGAPTKKVSFAVPTGNFGNIFAGYCASRMGLPIQQLVIGSNSNDIITRFFETGSMVMSEVVPTTSPSMDIQISSNFERFLFELYGHNSDEIVQLMNNFQQNGKYSVNEELWQKAKTIFDSCRCDDDKVQKIIAETFQNTGEMLDPHSAIGFFAGKTKGKYPEIPMVTFATAHAAKFSNAVKAATGKKPHFPNFLNDLLEREEFYVNMSNNQEKIQAFIRENAGKRKKT